VTIAGRRAVLVLLVLGLLLGMTCKKKNQPPGVPSIPSGPTSGRKGDTLRFSAIAEDPDGGSVQVRFDWGDSTVSDWSQLVRNGDSVVMAHAWQKLGTYSIRAQARGAQDNASTWSGETQLRLASFLVTYGGKSQDFGTSVQQTADGGYVITGTTWSYGAGGCDVYLIKTDGSGDRVWSRTFGGRGYDRGNSVQQTTDGGYIIVGGTNSFGAGLWDVYVVKTDDSGNQLWSRTFGGRANDEGSSVAQTTDGGYVITGYWYFEDSISPGAFLLKIDASGNQVWLGNLGGSDYRGYEVQQTEDGGYVVTGLTGYPYHDVFLVKVDTSGSQVWSRTFGGDGDNEGYSVRQTSDTGYIVCGTTDPRGAGDFDVYLTKTDASGSEVWSRTLDEGDCGRCVRQTSDGGYIIAANALVKTDAQGIELWSRAIGGRGGAAGRSVQQTSDGGYVIAGTTPSSSLNCNEVYLQKTDAEGN
jgi:uncharacterized protein (UPF0248 family)